MKQHCVRRSMINLNMRLHTFLLLCFVVATQAEVPNQPEPQGQHDQKNVVTGAEGKQTEHVDRQGMNQVPQEEDEEDDEEDDDSDQESQEEDDDSDQESDEFEYYDEDPIELIQDGYVRPNKIWLEEMSSNQWGFSVKDRSLLLIFKWLCPYQLVKNVWQTHEKDCIAEAELTYADNEKQKTIVMDTYKMTFTHLDDPEKQLNDIKPLDIKGHIFTVGLVLHPAEKVEEEMDHSKPKIHPKVCKKVTYTIEADEKVTKNAVDATCEDIDNFKHQWLFRAYYFEDERMTDTAIAEHLGTGGNSKK